MMSKLMEKLKSRWGVESYGQVIIILFLFSITGFVTLYIRRMMFDLFGITSDTVLWIRITAWLFIVFPSYQVLFLIFGFLMGQFDFVWRFEKKNFKRIKEMFVRAE